MMFEGCVTAPSESFARVVGNDSILAKKFIQDNLSALWLPSSGSTTENSQSAFETLQIKKILATFIRII